MCDSYVVMVRENWGGWKQESIMLPKGRAIKHLDFCRDMEKDTKFGNAYGLFRHIE